MWPLLGPAWSRAHHQPSYHSGRRVPGSGAVAGGSCAGGPNMLNPHRRGWAALLCSGKTSLACASVPPKTHGCPLQGEVSEVTGWPPEGWCHSGGLAVAWGAAFTGGASSSLPKAALLMGPEGSICVAELRAHSVNWSPALPLEVTDTCSRDPCLPRPLL